MKVNKAKKELPHQEAKVPEKKSSAVKLPEKRDSKKAVSVPTPSKVDVKAKPAPKVETKPAIKSAELKKGQNQKEPAKPVA